MTAKQEDCDGSCDECDDVGECALTELINDVPLARQPVEHENPEVPLESDLDELTRALRGEEVIHVSEAACDGVCTECNGVGMCELDDEHHELVPNPHILEIEPGVFPGLDQTLNTVPKPELELSLDKGAVKAFKDTWTQISKVISDFVGLLVEPTPPVELKHPGDEGFVWPCPSDEGCRQCADGAECNDMREPAEAEAEAEVAVFAPTLFVRTGRTVGDQDVIEYRLATLSEILVAASKALDEQKEQLLKEILDPCQE